MGNANFVEPLSLAGGIRIKILVLTYINWFVVSQIAPSLASLAKPIFMPNKPLISLKK